MKEGMDTGGRGGGREGGREGDDAVHLIGAFLNKRNPALAVRAMVSGGVLSMRKRSSISLTRCRTYLPWHWSVVFRSCERVCYRCVYRM